MEKRASEKLFRPIISIVLFLAIAVMAAGCGQSDDKPEQQAQIVLDQLLSCTMQQAEELDAAITGSISIEEPESAEPGLVQGDDELMEYLTKRFGDFMTDTCIDDLAKNRTFYQSVAWTQDFNADVKADKIELTERSGEQGVYNFQAEVKTSEGASAADVAGTITMEKEGTEWKASKVALNVVK